MAGARKPSGVLYEFPLRDSVRLFLRLEVLGQQLQYAAAGRSPNGNRSAAHAVLTALDLLFRWDLRAHLLQEVYHLQRNYKVLRAREDIRQDGLSAILEELGQYRDELVQMKANEVRTLRFDTLLSALHQRDSVTDAAMAVDLPLYQWWLQSDPERCRADVDGWIQSFQPILEANHGFLTMVRQRGEFRDCVAEQGLFTASVSRGQELWMVRVTMPARAPCFPQVSGASDTGKIHLSFLRAPSGKEAAEPYRDDCSFRLSVC